MCTFYTTRLTSTLRRGCRATKREVQEKNRRLQKNEGKMEAVMPATRLLLPWAISGSPPAAQTSDENYQQRVQNKLKDHS